MIEYMPIQSEKQWLAKRSKYITSTEVSSLYGLQMASLPTAYELWHIKRGLIDNDIKENNFMLWGKRLEAVIAQGIAEDNQLEIEHLKIFAYDDDIGIGSSFDYAIKTPDGKKALLEIKTTTYREYKQKFTEDDDGEFIEAPAYYDVQCQVELAMMPEYSLICLAIFILDTREVKFIWRDRDESMIKAIKNKVNEFWESTEPPPPDLAKDSDLLARLHRANNSDSSYDATENIDFDIAAMAYLQESQKESQAKEAKKIARSRMILSMGENNTAYCNVARVANKKSFRVTSTTKGDEE